MRRYAVSFRAVSVTSSQDFFEITPADDKPCRIAGYTLSQTSDVGDAAEEVVSVALIRGHTSSGSGGTTPTPAPFDSIDTAAGFTAEVNNTTQASSGTAAVCWEDGWNIRIPSTVWFDPEQLPRATQALPIVLRLLTSPADAITVSGTLIVDEV